MGDENSRVELIIDQLNRIEKRIDSMDVRIREIEKMIQFYRGAWWTVAGVSSIIASISTLLIRYLIGK